MMKKLFISTILLSLCLVSFSQKTGNIVEIFGKEKVESTKEGNIIHTFHEGLALRKGIKPGVINGYNDIVFWQIANGSFETPEAGQVVSERLPGQEEGTVLKWEAVTADEKGVFSDKLSASLLYTGYESPQSVVALLEATGHTRVYINGLPHEGDHYDYGYTLIPFRLKKGLNEFIYTYGRFSRYSSRIVIPHKEVFLTGRDMTLPSVLSDENEERLGAVRLINASEKALKGYRIECLLPSGESAVEPVGPVISLTTRKVAFRIPRYAVTPAADTLAATLILRNAAGKEADRMEITLKVSQSTRHHERTFISNIDGSVQYFSVAPSLKKGEGQSLVLSVHGASVEATNQARAYKQKDWAYIAAPTNRRPFGFNWEEWGRMDALEVLAEAKKLYKTDPQKTYLTGHSMGGHGSWFLGATYPGYWGTVSPCAGYPDVAGYRRSEPESYLTENPHFAMLERGASAGRVFNLAKNYLQGGVYVLHGDADAVVPVEHARTMRQLLGGFHNNFAYYEYPGGSHWYGDESVDWPPLFDFMKQNRIPETAKVDSLYFVTATPAVSAENHWIRVNQQERQYVPSSVKAVRHHDTLTLTTENIRSLCLLFGRYDMPNPSVILINGETLNPVSGENIHLIKSGSRWREHMVPNLAEKHPGRQGGFKLAFTHRVVFVYGTRGSAAQNEWYENKARYDAETFLYRGNGSVEVIPDREFTPARYKGRNVIIYGNADNNSAWKQLLANAPVKVTNRQIVFGNEILKGDDLGTFFIYPRPDSSDNLVGVVAGTGTAGMKALFPNDYFSGITGFPDLLIFDSGWLKDNPGGIRISGFFGNNWNIESGEFVK